MPYLRYLQSTMQNTKSFNQYLLILDICDLIYRYLQMSADICNSITDIYENYYIFVINIQIFAIEL